MRKCTKCHQDKELDAFYVVLKYKDGLSYWCKECHQQSAKQWVKNNPDRYHKNQYKWKNDNPNYSKEYLESNPEYNSNYYKEHSEEFKERSHNYYLENLDRCKALNIRWKKNNPDRKRELNRRYKKNNPDKILADTKSRQKRVKGNTPKWAKTGAIMKQIKDFYFNCPAGYHVDHIVPIKGINVSGLHVPWNMQYLLATDNCKKHNKF